MPTNEDPPLTPFDRKKKTLFILGAGFSMDAGGPAQAQILKKILGMSNESVDSAKTRFINFSLEHLGISEHRLSTVSLEDIYTPIDRCLADGSSLRGLDISNLLSIRSNIDFLIAKAIESELRGQESKSHYIREFAKTLVSVARHRKTLAHSTDGSETAAHYDPLAIISLNWDILLDNALHRELEHQDEEDGVDIRQRHAPLGVVDYCCYVSSLEERDNRVRAGLWALGAKGYNVKLLKLHGSLNWLQCETCQRLYVSYGEKSAVPNYLEPGKCRHCDEQRISSKLRSTLVMPTFLKDLSNFQLKLIWQNAGIEIMEAWRLVFIGYSLPYADFEFRQLLSRFSHKDVEVDVVLFANSQSEDRLYTDAVGRFREFFNAERIRVFSCGAAKYVKRCSWSEM
jgi:hypothetical protein